MTETGVLTMITTRHEALTELWYDLRSPYRAVAVRRFLCAVGLHWPITFWACRGGYSSPPEYGWACEQCGHERLPYRAWLWRVPLVRRVVR